MHLATCATGAALAVVVAGGAAVAAPAPTGPSSSQSPYLVRTAVGVVTTSVLTVGDAAPDGYRMVGKPDGLGAFDNGDGTFTLLMNHELAPREGIARDHGQTGAFVSRWRIDKETLRVLAGDDQIQRVLAPTADGGWEQVTTMLNRLCSANLAPQSAFYDAASGAGTTHRLYMNGEEQGTGRALAHVVEGPDAGSSYILPELGRAGWENIVAWPGLGPRTVTVNSDDNTQGQVYVYVGRKRTTGNDVERAGLTGGTLYGIKVDGMFTEDDATRIPGGGVRFSLVEIPGASRMSESALNQVSNTLGITRFNRAEDVGLDPTDRRGMYLASTASFAGISRLWHLRFDDPADPTGGGVIEVAAASPPYDAADPQGPRMMDNLAVNVRGQVVVQEDAGNNPYLSGVWQYDPQSSGETHMVRIAKHDPARFVAGAPAFLTESEESSGIIPAPFLGAGKYLLTSMAHYANGDPETVQGGQLLVLNIPPGRPVGLPSS